MAIDKPRGDKALARSQTAVFTNPFSVMRRLSDDMERMINDRLEGQRLPRVFKNFDLAGSRWTPDVEAFERKGEFIVRADLPGMTKDGISVEISDDELVIQGERKEEAEQTEKGYYAYERSYGTFSRAVPLPEGVKADEAKASFKDGVLEIAMPAGKASAKHSRQIEIK